MRKQNTFKKIFIICALVLSLGLATFGAATLRKTKADSTVITANSDADADHLTIDYVIYDYNAYCKYTDIKAMVDYALEEGYDLVKKKKGSYTLGDDYGDYADDIWSGVEASFTLPSDPSQTGFQKYGESITDILGASPSVDATTGAIAELEALKVPLSSIEQGQQIVVEVYVELSGGRMLNYCSVTLPDDLGGKATALNFTATHNESQWNTTYNTSSTYNDGFNSDASTPSRTIGGQDTASTNTGPTGRVFLGALGYEIKSTATGELKISPVGCSDTNYGYPGNPAGFNAGDDPTHFVSIPTGQTVAGIVTDDATIASIEVNTGNSTPETFAPPTEKADGVNTVSNGNKPASSKTSVTVSFTLSSGGATIDSVKSKTGSGSYSTIGVAGTNPATITLGKPGETTTVEIKTTSQDGTKHCTYEIVITKKQYEDRYLDSVGTFTSNGATNPTLSPAFASNGSGFTLNYASDATSIQFTPTFNSTAVADGGKGMTAQIQLPGGGSWSNLTSGQIVTISSGISNGAQFNIRVYAQDTTLTPKTYTFTLAEKSADNSLVVKVSDGSTNYAGGFSGTTWTLTNPLPYKVNYATVTLSNPKGATIVVELDSVTQSNPANISFNTPSTVNAVTKTLNVTVTSQAGVAKNYTVELERKAANTHNELNQANTKVYAVPKAGSGLTTQLVPGTWSGNTWTASSNVGFEIDHFYVTPVLDDLCKEDSAFVATMKVGSTAVTSGGNTPNMSFGTGFAQIQKSIVLDVTSESGAPAQYTFEVTREKADEDCTLAGTPTVNTVTPGSSVVVLDDWDSTNNIWKNTTYIDAKYSDALIGNLVPTKNTSTVEVSTNGSSWVACSSGTYTLPLNRTNTTKSNTLYVKVTAQNTTKTKIYQITLWSQALQVNRNFTATVTSLGDNATVAQLPTSTPTVHYYEIAKNPGGTSFNIKFDLAADSDRAKLYWGTSATSQTTPLNDGDTIPSQTIGAYGAPTLIYVKIVSEFNVPEVHTYNVQHTDTRDTNNKIADIKVYAKDYKNNTTLLPYTFNQADDVATLVAGGGTGVFEILNIDYKYTQIQFVVTLEKSTSKLDFGGTVKSPDSSGSTIVTIPYSSNVLSDGHDQTYTFKGISEATTVGPEYQIRITRKAAETDKNIVSLKINSTPVTPVLGGYKAFGISVTGATLELEVSDKASYKIKYDSTTIDATPHTITPIADGTYKLVTIEVTSEKDRVNGTGSPNVYYVYIINANQNTTIDNIEIFEDAAGGSDLTDKNGNSFVYTPGVQNYVSPAFVITYAAGQPYFEVTKSPTNPNVVISGQTGLQTVNKSQTGETKTFTITVNSQYNNILSGLTGVTPEASQTDTYKIKIQREAPSHECELQSLVITINGTPETINLTTPQNIENVGTGIASATIDYVKKDQKSIITNPTDSNDNNTKTSGQFEYSLNLMNSNEKTKVEIKVYAEDGINFKNYSFWVATDTVTLNTNNEITSIILTGDKTTNNQMAGFTQANDDYPITLPGANGKVYLTVAPAVSTTSIYIAVGSSASLAVVPTTNMPYEVTLGAPGTTTDIFVRAKSQSGVDGTLYKIHVTREALDDDATLKTFRIEEFDAAGNPVGDEVVTGWDPSKEGGNFIVKVKNNVEYIKLVPTLNSTKATLNNTADTNKAVVVGDNGPFTVSVTPEDPDSTKVKYYNVHVERDDVNTATMIVVQDKSGNAVTLSPEFAENGNSFSGSVSYKVDKVDIIVTLRGNPAYLTVTGDGERSLSEGNNPLQVTITTNSGVPKVYTFNITRTAGQQGLDILTYTDSAIDGPNKVPHNFAQGAPAFDYNVPRTTSTWNPLFTLSPGATSNFDTIKSQALTPGKNVRTLTVTNEVGDTKDYTITIYATQTTKTVDTIKLFKDNTKLTEYVDKTDGTKKISLTVDEITVPYGTSSILTGYLEVKVNSLCDHAVVYIDSTQSTASTVQINQGVNTYSVRVLSEDDVAKGLTGDEYVITVNRDLADTDAHLQSLIVEIKDGGVWSAIALDPVFQSTDETKNYKIENAENVTNVRITAQAVKSTTAINNNSNLNGGQSGTYQAVLPFESLTASGDGYSKDFEIVTLAEDGLTSYTFTITIARGSLDVDSENTIKSISLVDSTGKTHLNTNNPVTTPYQYTIPYSATSVTFNVEKGSIVSPSTIVYKKSGSPVQSEKSKTSYIDNITSAMRGQTIEYKVQAIAQDGTPGDEYIFRLFFAQPDQDAWLSYLYADSEQVAGFDPTDHSKEHFTYVLSNRKYTTSSINLYAITNSSLAKITGIGVRPLDVGLNTFDIFVTAEDGLTQKTYTIKVTREEQDPYLTNLTVTGKQLLTTSLGATTYNRETDTYVVKATYFDENITFVTSTDNSTYIVSASNGQTENIVGNSKTFKSGSLNVGDNYITITVMSQSGKSKDYTLLVRKSDQQSASATVSNIDVKGQTRNGLEEVSGYQYEDGKTLYTNLSVTNDVTELKFNVSKEFPNETVEVLNNTNLKVGDNKVYVVITAEDGVSKNVIEYNVKRAEPVYSVAIDKVSQFKPDYAANAVKSMYEVESKDYEVNVSVEAVGTTAEGFTYSPEKVALRPGDNTFVLVITDPCGEKTITQVNIHRNNMSFSINQGAYAYNCTAASNNRDSDTDWYYTIDMNGDAVSKINNFANYVTNLSDGCKIQVLTNTSYDSVNEVLLRVSNIDETEVKYVHFKINNAPQAVSNNGALNNAILWVMIGILALLLLLIIFILIYVRVILVVMNNRRRRDDED